MAESTTPTFVPPDSVEIDLYCWICTTFLSKTTFWSDAQLRPLHDDGCIFSRVHATLYPALPVRWLVGRSVGRSVVIKLRMMKMHRILEISQIIASFHKVDAILHHS